jgi:DNA-binding GntR family transcriptional regulator
MTDNLGDEVSIGRQNISEQIAHVLRDYILSGRLKPGERIVQADWADRLKVSRMPVRDAINTLVLQGTLVQSHTGAAVVAEIDARDVADGYRLNAMISSVAARRAAEVITDETLDALTRINESIVVAVDDGDRDRASRMNWEFHRTINSASGSARLRALLGMISPSIPHSAFELIDQWPQQAVSDHNAIIEALRARDGDLTADLMLRHIEAGSSHMLRELDRQLHPGGADHASG